MSWLLHSDYLIAIRFSLWLMLKTRTYFYRGADTVAPPWQDLYYERITDTFAQQSKIYHILNASHFVVMEKPKEIANIINMDRLQQLKSKL